MSETENRKKAAGHFALSDLTVFFESKMEKTAVLIPCYNEEHTIGKVIKGFKEALPEAVIYVYDNNSTDHTAAFAAGESAIVRYECRKGKGNVIRRMFREINADCYILVDGDMTYSPRDAVEMVRLIHEKKADMVVGDRISSAYAAISKRRFHSMGNRMVTGAVNLLFATDYKDVMTGYRCLSYAFVKSFPAISNGFEVETEMSIHAADHDLAVENMEIAYRDRPDGSCSKLHTVSDGIRIILMIGKMFRLYRPFSFFMGVALAMAAVSTFFIIPVLVEYQGTHLVERFPTLIVCGFTYLAALLSMYTGIILQTMRSRERREFELSLKALRRINDL